MFVQRLSFCVSSLYQRISRATNFTSFLLKFLQRPLIALQLVVYKKRHIKIHLISLTQMNIFLFFCKYQYGLSCLSLQQFLIFKANYFTVFHIKAVCYAALLWTFVIIFFHFCNGRLYPCKFWPDKLSQSNFIECNIGFSTI